MFKSFKNRNTFDLIWELFRTDFKLKYNDSILGFLWVLIKPFALFSIIYFVLSRVFPNRSIEYFPLYLLLGNMFFNFWAEGTQLGMGSLISRAGLITKINFPRYIVLISSTLIAFVNFLINMSIFLVLTISLGTFPTNPLYFLWFIAISLLLYFLVVVVSMFLSIAYVRFRDLLHIWELTNQLLFWTTPIIYTIDNVANNSRLLHLILTKLNPLSVFLTSARNAMIYNNISNLSMVMVWAGIIVLFGGLGYLYYKNSIKRIAEFF